MAVPVIRWIGQGIQEIENNLIGENMKTDREKYEQNGILYFKDNNRKVPIRKSQGVVVPNDYVLDVKIEKQKISEIDLAITELSHQLQILQDAKKILNAKKEI